jgi:hypothetical protein
MSGYFEPGYIEEGYFEEEGMAVTPLPQLPLARDLDPIFAQKSGLFLSALPQFALELEAVITAMNNNSTSSSAGAPAGSFLLFPLTHVGYFDRVAA